MGRENRAAVSNVFAVDLGATKTALALVDANGAIAEKHKLPSAHTFEETVAQIVNRFPHGAAAAGLVVPGIYDPHTGRVWAPNLWGPETFPLRDALEQRLGSSVTIGSDRAGYVLGEHWLGAARGLNDVVFVAVGTGIGVGIVSNGRPIEGAHGTAGAAGWMVVGGPWKSEYEKAGGWETEAAGPALARRAGMETAEAVVADARAGNPKALDAVRQTADILALGIANLIAVLNPEMVVLGGGLMHAADLMLQRIRSQALRWTQPIAAKATRIEKTALGEDAGLLGAARLAWLRREKE